jgi:hypothetical protein
MKLAELQAMFQAGVLAGEEPDDAAILDKVRNSGRVDRATLFGVYVDAYRARLSEFLAADFPALRALLGEERFEALAADYIAAEPARRRNPRWYTTRLPDFMAQSEAWRDPRALDLALFERALTDAFDAPDAAPLALTELAGFAPQDWPRLSFGFHPSLRLLDLSAGTVATHEAAMEEQELPPTGEGVEHVAVWRADLDSAYRELEPDEFLVLSLAVAGHVFDEICRLAAFRDESAASPERIAHLLSGWFEDGLVVSAALGRD